MVYLDIYRKYPTELNIKLGGIIDIYEKFMGDDPCKIPMNIFLDVHYSMGGLLVFVGGIYLLQKAVLIKCWGRGK